MTSSLALSFVFLRTWENGVGKKSYVLSSSNSSIWRLGRQQKGQFCRGKTTWRDEVSGSPNMRLQASGTLFWGALWLFAAAYAVECNCFTTCGGRFNNKLQVLWDFHPGSLQLMRMVNFDKKLDIPSFLILSFSNKPTKKHSSLCVMLLLSVM